ncbi:unnamed protein product, partial [Staurois parvus]
MLKSPPSSSVGDDYQESNGRVAEQKHLQLKVAVDAAVFGSQTQASVKKAEAVSSVSRRRGTWRRVCGGGSSKEGHT